MAADFRKHWMKERVLMFLNEECNDTLFDNLLYRNGNKAAGLLDEFLAGPLEGTHDHKRIIVIFYKTYYNKTVLEEMDVQEQVTLPTSVLEPVLEAAQATTEPKRKKSKGNIKKKRKDSKKTSESTEVNETNELTTLVPEQDDEINASLPTKDGTADSGEDETAQEVQSLEEVEKDEDKGKKKKKEGKSKKAKKGRRSPITMVEEAPKLPTPPPEFVTVKKVVSKVIRAPQLHCHFGAMSGNKVDLNQQYVYFIRQSWRPIPLTDTWEEAIAEMPVYFLVGSIHGNLLISLRTLVKQVFIPLISCQFQDPLLELKLKSRMNEDGEAHYPPTVEAFCRPSDFWRMAVKMKQSFVLEDEYIDDPKLKKDFSLTVKRKSLEDELSMSSSDSEAAVDEIVVQLPELDENAEGAIDLDELVAAHLGMPLGEITSTIRRKSSMTSATSRRTSCFQTDETSINIKCEPFKFEMLAQLTSLIHMIEWTKNHLIGDMSLAAPDLLEVSNTESNPETLSQSEEVVKKLTETVLSWNEHIKKNLKLTLSKKPVGNGPLAEYSYWYELEAELSILQEQLNAPTVKRIVEILTFARSECLTELSQIESDLNKYFVETRDNVRFLSTILCHFKVLEESNCLVTIKSCLNDLMEGLRIIWHLSVFYSRDENMASLLERIKFALCDKVSTLLNVSKLFNQDLRYVAALTGEALELLSHWKECYLGTRARIETTGTSTRWEFDKEMLFSESDYMAAVADDLNHVAKVMLEFHNIFGAELKAIINDPVQIDAVVKKVESMCHPIVKADFEIFSKDSKEHWDNIMQWFENQVIAIENEAKYFINESFTLLRCSEEALDTLQKFNFIDTRLTIRNQLKTKYEPILHQFMKEVNIIDSIFQGQKSSPPLLRNYPPVAGSIFWERFLFNRIKRPILAFQKVNALTSLSFKKTVFQEYLSLVKQMKEYEDEHFEEWSKNVVSLMIKAMKEEVIELIEIERFVDLVLNEQSKKAKEDNLRLISLKHLKQLRSKTSKSVSRFKMYSKLKGGTSRKLGGKQGDKGSQSDPAQASSAALAMSPFALTMKWLTQSQSKADHVYSTKYGHLNPQAKLKRIHAVAWGEFIKDALLIELKLGIRLNFKESLFEVISEAKLMEQLSFKLPWVIQKLISIEAPLFDSFKVVKNMVDEYTSLVMHLDVPQLLFAKDHLRDVENQLHPGLMRLNWTSLQIKDFAKNVLQRLNNLRTLVSQMERNSEKLNERMLLISSFDLFDLFSQTQSSGNIAGILCFDFFEKLALIQSEKMKKILSLYKLLGPILIKLESTVLQTSSGQSPFMIFYYNNCEKKIFNTLIEVCVDNLHRFNEFLKGNRAFIIIEAHLGAQEVHLEPNFIQIYNLITIAVRRFMEHFLKIPRWMHGTCLLCPEIFSENKESKHLFSFYDDLVRVESINNLLVETQETTRHLVKELSKYLSKWNKYSNVWLLDKDVHVSKFAAQNPKLNAYEEEFSYYSDMLQELDSIKTHIDIQCIRINLNKLIDSLKMHLISWKDKLGEKLANDTRSLMMDFKTKMTELKLNLELGVSEVVSFKIVLQAISDIKLLIVEAELIFDEIDERYHIMALQNIQVPLEDQESFSSLKLAWNSLLDLSIYRKLSLESAKSVFAKITEGEIRKFGHETELFAVRFYAEGPGSVKKHLKNGEQLMADWRTLFESMNREKEEMLKVEKLFDLPMFCYDQYLGALSHFQGLEVIYQLYYRLKASREQWGKMSWMNFNSQLILEGIDTYLEEFKQIPESIRSSEAGIALETMMLQFKESVPLLVKLKNEAIRKRHWTELMSKTGKYFDISPDMSFSLECVFDMELYNQKSDCLEIINRALKELAIELSIKEIVSTWESMKLEIVKCEQNTTNLDHGYMLEGVAEILLLLEHHTMILQTIANSDFVGSFLNVVQEWEVHLSNISETLDAWMQFQSIWLHLGVGIFSNSCLALHLSEEKLLFDSVDAIYEKIMIETFKNPRILDQCLDSSAKISELMSLISKLEHCRKALDFILEEKRIVYPRFCFLSDDELLAVLGSLKPTDIQKYLPKLFDCIKGWKVFESNDSQTFVTAVISSGGEVMDLRSFEPVVGQLENWMKSTTNNILRTNWFWSKKAVFSYGTEKQPRSDWILDYQGTVCHCASLVWWTAEVENVFTQIENGDSLAMKEYLKIQNEQLTELSEMIQSKNHESQQQTNIELVKLSNMMILDIHCRDIIRKFVQHNVLSMNDFEWRKQLRFYWRKASDTLTIEQCSTVLSHGFEYSGLNERLVVTALSDRFCLTVTQAIFFHMGILPIGLAGSGKSETIRDLARTLGLLSIAIHCNMTLHSAVFNQILKGLCQCGAWGCFENINELDVHTLAVLSIEFQSVYFALKNRLSNVLLAGHEIKFINRVNFFILFNPNNYCPDSLPASLKCLFRSVAYTSPDLEFICFVILLSKGFSSAKILSKKLSVLFKLLTVKLSKEDHYDFGIRTLKSALFRASEFKKSDDLEESVLIVRALKDIFSPKLISDDISLFNELLKDIFFDIYYPSTVDGSFVSVIKMSLQETGNILVEKQVEKCAHLFNLLQIHHSCMLIGRPGGGKTAIFETLIKMFKNLNFSTTVFTLSPKSCSVQDLYGFYDPETKQWRDGVLTHVFRSVNSDFLDNEKKFISFDGEIDSSWIENVSSVLDQTKLLTLGNGEQIRLLPHCYLVFEVSHLKFAPPSVVSKFGIIYVSPKDLGFEPFWERWINKFSQENIVKLLKELSKKYLQPILSYVFSEHQDLEEEKAPVRLIVSLSPLNTITQLCFILDVFLMEFVSRKVLKINEDILEALFIEGLYASFGAVIASDGRDAFDTFVKRLTGFNCTGVDNHDDVNLRCLPSKNTLFGYFVNVKDSCWSSWEKFANSQSLNISELFREIFVPTAESCKLSSYLNRINEFIKKPTILVSEETSHKTSFMNYFLKQLSSDQFEKLKISFCARTSSSTIRSCIEKYLEKRTKKVYGPARKKMICFFDDLNTPKIDDYGAQQAIVFLKSLFEKGGFFHQEGQIQWRVIKDVGYYGAFTERGGGRNSMDPRFVSLVFLYNVSHLSDSTASFIFSSILTRHTSDFCKNIQSVVPGLIQATLEIFQDLKAKIPPIPHKFHYTFNMHDLSKIMASLCLTSCKIFTHAKQFIRVWRNEFTRVICDRLTSKDDFNLVQNSLVTVTEKYFPDTLDYVIRNPLLFGDFRNATPGDGVTCRDYEDLLDYDAVFHLFEEVLLKFNEENPAMNLILFNDALEHLTRLQRIFRMKNGHILFLGSSGLGRGNLLRLAAFTAGCDVLPLGHRLNYTASDFKREIKQSFVQVGDMQKPTALLLNTSQMMDEGFYEILSDIITACLRPTFFNESDKKLILDKRKQASPLLNEEEIWSSFMMECVANVHVAIIVTMKMDDFRALCQNFPCLLRLMHQNWNFNWPTEALYIIAETFLTHQDLIPDKHLENLIAHLVVAHGNMEDFSAEYHQLYQKKICITPSNYLNSIQTLLSLLEERHDFIAAKRQTLNDGIWKINQVFEHVEELKAKLALHSFMISEKNEDIQKILDETDAAENIFQEAKAELAERRKEMDSISKELRDDKFQVEEMSSKIALSASAAKDALSSLENDDILELSSYVAPPEAVQNVCECITILLGAKEITWKKARSVIAEPDFLSSLMNLNCSQISQKQQQACRVHLKAAKKMEILRDISKAGYRFYLFIEEVLECCTVYKEIKSRNGKISILEEELRVGQNYMTQLNYKMKEASVTLDLLHQAREKSELERETFENERKGMEGKILLADELVSVLHPQYSRWMSELDVLKADIDRVLGDCLICASFLSYAGPFNQKYRYGVIYSSWLSNIVSLNIPVTQPFDPVKIFRKHSDYYGGEPERNQICEFEIQNEIIIERARRFILCIDPQEQAFDVIKLLEPNLQMLSFSDVDYIEQLENALKFGTTVLFKEVTFIDPIIYNILDRRIINSGDRSYVSLGGKQVEYNPKFKMYFTSSSAYPDFPQSVFSKTSVVDFTVTHQGVTGKLLDLFSKADDGCIERAQLMKDKSSHQRTLTDLHNIFIKSLLSSKERLLDHFQEVESLLNVNNQISAANKKLEGVEETMQQVEKMWQRYEPVACEVAVLFFVFIEMSLINNIYQYSLETFLIVFRKCLDSLVSTDSSCTDISSWTKSFILYFHKFGYASVLKEHKLFFSFLIAVKIDQYHGSTSQAAVSFLTSDFKVDEVSFHQNSPIEWLSQKNWNRVLKLTEHFPNKFCNLPAHIEENSIEWAKCFDTGILSLSENLLSFTNSLAPFEILMLLSCLHREKIRDLIKDFVSFVLGLEFLQSLEVNVTDMYAYSCFSTPIFVFHHSNFDPSSDIVRLFRKCSDNSEYNLKSISCCHETVERIFELLETMAINGGWLIVKHFHSLCNTGNKLEKRFMELTLMHAQFRLWLLASPSLQVPSKLLRNSVKLVYEPATDLKSNLKNTYSQLQSETFHNCNHPYFKTILYALAFFHAVIQERGKYGKIGWNISYEFTLSDFDLSVGTFEIHLHEALEIQHDIPWPTLKYLIDEIIYGNKIVQEHDKTVLHTLVEEYFGDFLFDQFQGFHFFKNDFVDYSLPSGLTIEDYLNSIELLPSQNHPGVFGFHENIEMRQNFETACQLWATIGKLRKDTSDLSIDSGNEKIVGKIVNDLLSELIEQFKVEKIKSSFKMVVTPAATVLLQELKVFNLLLQQMSLTLIPLEKALNGKISLNEHLENVCVSVLSNQIPAEWRKYSPESCKTLAGWVNHFRKRKMQFLSWSVRGDPVVMWLSGLYSPKSYLIALLQTACQRKSWSLDRSSFYSVVTKFMSESEVEERPEVGCFIEGIFIEGARWDIENQCLAHLKSKVLIEEMPILMIQPIESCKMKLEGTLRTPVYVTSNRCNSENKGLVFHADLKSDRHLSFWILSGTCLLLNNDAEPESSIL